MDSFFVAINVKDSLIITHTSYALNAFESHVPITPNCCGDNDVSCMMPGIDPDANDNRSDSAMIEPPGDTDRADAFDPANDIISAK